MCARLVWNMCVGSHCLLSWRFRYLAGGVGGFLRCCVLTRAFLVCILSELSAASSSAPAPDSILVFFALALALSICSLLTLSSLNRI